jgi:uncharacterized membrane protein YtjA (UPF0391 family)
MPVISVLRYLLGLDRIGFTKTEAGVADIVWSIGLLIFILMM